MTEALFPLALAGAREEPRRMCLPSLVIPVARASFESTQAARTSVDAGGSLWSMGKHEGDEDDDTPRVGPTRQPLRVDPTQW